MASDPNKPLLRLTPNSERDRPLGAPKSIPRPEAFPQDRQTREFSPKFNRLAEVLSRDPAGIELTGDPTALAPERLLVFEVRGPIGQFASAVRNVPGLELVDEEELEGDENDNAPVAYLMVPDMRALRDLEGLWRRWLGNELKRGETPWRDVFALLRDLRPWGPQDRVQPAETTVFEEQIFGHLDTDLIRLEVELVYRSAANVGAQREAEVVAAVAAQGGTLVASSRIDDIAYHALLVDLPIPAIRRIIEHAADGIAGLEPVMHVRPQSIASSIELNDVEPGTAAETAAPVGDPILAVLDGVPIAGHPLLARHVVVDDQFGLEPTTPVVDRIHGTAMCSLVVHGDLNRRGLALPRRIHVVPVLGANDRFPANRLIVDVIYTAVLAMRQGADATAPGVLIVNLSLANARRPFHGQLSAWARVLDRLSYRFGLLFIVSAGNCSTAFAIAAYETHTRYEDADPTQRATETLRALGQIVADRRLYSPAETVNGLTVGAYNDDAVSAAHRTTARVNVDPYGGLCMPNPSSALGPGFALSVKPDVLLPGAREHLTFVRSDGHIEVRPSGPTRAAGLRVASPPRAGQENVEGYTCGTSAAAALASRTAHRIHDALEEAYGDAFRNLTHVQRAVLLKALIVHPAKWPADTALLIRSTLGPPEGKFWVRQRDNIRRFLGFGMVDADDAVACAADRATFWATGMLRPDKTAVVDVPVPVAMRGEARMHSLSATLAWFTPTAPRRKSYRTVRLKLLTPTDIDILGVSAHPNQPDGNQTNRGTVFTQCWSGTRAPVVTANMSISLIVQRDPDQGTSIDEPIPFGLAVTLEMPGIVEIYDQVRQRLGITARAAV